MTLPGPRSDTNRGGKPCAGEGALLPLTSPEVPLLPGPSSLPFARQGGRPGLSLLTRPELDPPRHLLRKAQRWAGSIKSRNEHARRQQQVLELVVVQRSRYLVSGTDRRHEWIAAMKSRCQVRP